MKISTYRTATTLASCLISAHLEARKKKGKEDIARFDERLGIPSLPRPEGKLVWMHGASVGETISMLPLIDLILKTYPDIHILVTSGTVTSAEIMAKRLPERAFHQYIPVDIAKYAEKFIKFWHPDLALWFESDFWPNILSEAKLNEIPLILVNGRISDRSFKNWQKLPSLMKEIQGLFVLSLGQTKLDADRLKALGANEADCVGNIKFAGSDIPFDDKVLAELKAQIGTRPVFLAASTHFDEERKISLIHSELKKKIPNILTIIVPRHPVRGADIMGDIKLSPLTAVQRSRQQEITPDTDIYVADTIGEMGVFYRLAEVVFVGGSLVPHGGQNFLEPAKLDSAVIVGPFMDNFKEMTDNALAADAISLAKNEDDVFNIALTFLTDENKRQERIAKAKSFAQNEADVLIRVFGKIKKWLD